MNLFNLITSRASSILLGWTEYVWTIAPITYKLLRLRFCLLHSPSTYIITFNVAFEFKIRHLEFFKGDKSIKHSSNFIPYDLILIWDKLFIWFHKVSTHKRDNGQPLHYIINSHNLVKSWRAPGSTFQPSPTNIPKSQKPILFSEQFLLIIKKNK